VADSTERRRKLEDLFTEAGELTGDEQHSFIERETADDPELRGRLLEMLADADAMRLRIADIIDRVAQSAAPQHSWTGRRFGSYRILREIGRGGMGIVFEAVRDDGEYQKRVALKIAPDWREIGLLHERLRHERQIVAQLEHPNIARFLDGGTEEGSPYFAMEYVDGVRITQYAAALELVARIELFRTVCSAVEYAHGNLVVHRDLKPSNILVTQEGVPKLLDFGIAKLASPVEGAAATMPGAMLWTPDYASPEQVRGGAVTTRTDVYSLGLILYELATGARAQKADTSSPLALDRSVCETDPPSANLPRDLDSIIRMAIRKEPERRYASVTALSDDLLRYLQGRPVQARPGTASYRAGKFVRRHSALVALTVLVVVSLAAGAVTTIYEARRADRRFNLVRQLANTFVFDVHDSIANVPGTTEARKRIVKTALVYLEKLREDAAGDASLLRELAGAYERIGDVQGRPTGSNLGDAAGALASYRTAERLLSPLASKHDGLARRQVASVDFKLALLQNGQGNTKESLEKYSQARLISNQLLDQSPRDRELLDLAGEINAGITRTLSGLGDYAGAEDAAQATMEIAQRLVDLDPTSPDYRGNLSVALSGLGRVQVGANRLEEAANSFRDSLKIRERLVEEEPTHSSHRRNLLVGYGQLGDVLGFQTGTNLGDIAGATAAFQKAFELAEGLSRSDPADRTALFDLSSIHLRLGSIEATDANQADLALRHLETSEEINGRLMMEDPKNYRYRSNALFLDVKIGEVLATLHRNQEASERWKLAATTAAALVQGPQPGFQMVLAETHLALLRARSGEARAIEIADSAAREIERPPGFLTPQWNEATIYRDLGEVYFLLGKFPEAAPWFEKSLQRWRDLKASAALENQRRMQVAAVEADLAVCRSKR
jgi:serine/threonine protein kinase/tetratricopeptide (TPR) repeat protein